MARTYVENNTVEKLPADYTEEVLQKKFAGKIEALREELAEYEQIRADLDQITQTTDWQDTEAEKEYSIQELQAEYLSLYREQRPVQREYDEARLNADLLDEYGATFAQLYRIKDNNEKYGNPENISFVEVDITDNGDMLTQDQYFKMRADPEGRVRQLALHIEDEEEELEYNIGMMEYNQPNTPPQTKMQLSFEDETLEKLDEPKLKKIFEFCESHGLSTMDMEIRRFDGSLAEDEIQERINKGLEKIKKEKEALIAEENAKEAAQQRERQKELEAELQNIQAARGEDALTEEFLEDISFDLPKEGTVMMAGEADEPASLQTLQYVATKDLRAQKNMHKLAFGVATSAIPEDAVPDGIEVVTPDQTKSAAPVKSMPENNSAETVTGNIPPVDAPKVENAKTKTGEPVAQAAHSADENPQDASQQSENLPADENQNTQGEEAPVPATGRQAATTPQSVSVPQPAQGQGQPAQGQPAPQASTPKGKQKEAEKKFEKFLEENLSKIKKSSYFKRHTGWFGTGWTEYVVYDNEDPDNLKKDGMKNKDGSVKYNYAFKLFLNVDNDGNINFAYRTPNHRKLDETVVGGIVGQLKDLGNTYISFPPGMPKDDEKGMWRKAMGENGIVPIGMGLNRSKAEGMLKAAREKLSAEAFSDYQYRLGKQMQENNEQKGKKVDESEQIFIDGLINTHKYAAFTNAYSLVYKSKIKGILRADSPQEGAIDKIAAYRTLRKVFDVYKSAQENGRNLINAEGLTPEEKRQIRSSGLDSNVEKLTPQQMDRLYDILFTRQRAETDVRLCDELIKQGYSDISVRGAKATPKNIMKDELGAARDSCDSINDDLGALGIEEIKIIKIPNVRLDFERFFNVDLPAYRRAHPQQQNSSSSSNSNSAGGTSSEYNQPQPSTETTPQNTAAAAAPKSAKTPNATSKDVNANVATTLAAKQRGKGM